METRRHHSHEDAHGHALHGHGHASNNERRVALAAVLIGSFMLVEVAGGVWSGSLALLADAGHMVTDFAALALAWAAFRISRRPADWRRTYGFDRFQVLVAFTNGIMLGFIAAWIFYEAVVRLVEPAEVLGGTMMAVAVVGLLVNIGAFWLLHGADRENLNIRGAALHVLGDLLGSMAAIIAAVVILWTGWMPIDPLLSIAVGVLILRSAWQVMSEAGHILLEASPKGLDVRAIGPDLIGNIADVHDVHHVHAWSITQERQMVTLHACVAENASTPRAVGAIKARLKHRFGLDHVTVEIEHTDCADDHSKQAGHEANADGHSH